MSNKKPLKLSHKNITIMVSPELKRIRERIQDEFDERFNKTFGFSLEGKTEEEIAEHRHTYGKATGLAMALEIIDEETIIKPE